MTAPPPHSRRSPEPAAFPFLLTEELTIHTPHTSTAPRNAFQPALTRACCRSPVTLTPSLWDSLETLNFLKHRVQAEKLQLRSLLTGPQTGASQTQHFASQLWACSIHAAVPDSLIAGPEPLPSIPNKPLVAICSQSASCPSPSPHLSKTTGFDLSFFAVFISSAACHHQE